MRSAETYLKVGGESGLLHGGSIGISGNRKTPGMGSLLSKLSTLHALIWRRACPLTHLEQSGICCSAQAVEGAEETIKDNYTD